MEQINIIIGGQCSEKGVDYNCHINGELKDYYIGDSIKLRQVLINILGNAVKFTPTGKSVDFLVERVGGYDGKSTLRFVIRDTGVGMSKEFLPRIFDTFSQENSQAANKYGSSGLGMAITKNIVDMMNGNIDVQSEKGVGTTFTVTITLNDSDRNDESVEDIEIRPQDMSVLIVDDDSVACDHAKLILGNAGIATETALSGQEAVEKVKLRQARREPYNLIVIDWKMPEMDGVETTKAIRSEIGDETAIIILTAYNWDDILDEALEPGYYDAILMDMRMPEMNGMEATAAIRGLDRPDAKEIPIIALTANAFDEDVQRSLQAGMNAHLSKPVEPEVLFETLEELL
ncbi:response regulator [Butyrivibrio sp. VCD2006]|uniref:response regulator n=1 Tax=Butyrivibrio sp. VCD2006 TaxID=1280664 RepID=UPI0018CAB205|nr:response regulator [Butyrivibrio sp. VCD2006]